MKNYLTLLLIFCMSICLASSAFAQQTLFGNVKDDIGDPVIGGTVILLNGTTLVTGVATDFDGNYTINVDPGTYNVEFRYVGYTPQRIDGVEVDTKQRKKLDMEFVDDGGIILSRCFGGYKIPLIDISDPTQGMIIGSWEIRRLSKPN